MRDQADPPESIGDRVTGKPGKLSERRDPEPLKRLGKFGERLSLAEELDRLGGEELPRLALRPPAMIAGRRMRARWAAASAANRVGATPKRDGAASARRAMSRTPESRPP